MKAIIAAGGKGTRLRPLTFSSNKHLIPIANKPLLLYPIEAVAETGVREVGVVVNETRPMVEALLGTGKKWGLKISYINQPEALGLAHVVKISQKFLAGSPFVYHLGDNIFSEGIMKPFKHFVAEKPDALLTIVKHKENHRLGVPYFDANGKLEKIVEKPDNPPNKFGVPGLYFFNAKVFNAFGGKDGIKPSARGELEIPDLYTYMIKRGYRVDSEEVEGIWLDPGKFDDTLEANRLMLEKIDERNICGVVDKKSNLTDVVEIGEGSKVVNSKIIGPVSIAEGVVIKDCQIGPYVSVDDDCVLESVKIEDSVIMKEAKIKNVKDKIIDSLIGKKTNIWEEKEELVRLFIGDNCRVRLT